MSNVIPLKTQKKGPESGSNVLRRIHKSLIIKLYLTGEMSVSQAQYWIDELELWEA